MTAPGAIDVRVVPVPGFPDRYAATAVLDGRETSFDCCHLHHSEETAQRCVRKVEISWSRYVALQVVQTEPWTVMELALPRQGRWQTRRFTYNDERTEP